MRSSALLSASIAAIVLLSACSSDPDTAASEPLGTIQLALVQAPSNLACMRITVTGNVTSTQFISVTPGASTSFMLMGLPTGMVSVKADGFSQACAMVTMTTVPAWVSNVATATLTPGMAATINLTMMPNGSATIVTDFPTPNPTTPDTTRPTLTSFTPVNGATNVAKNTAITANFSEPIALASLMPSSFSLDDLGLAVTGNYTTLGNAAIFSPASPLGPNQTYTARLSTGIRDLAGNALMTGTSWTFRTQDGAFTFTNPALGFQSNGIFDHQIAASRTGEVFDGWSQSGSAVSSVNVNRFVPGMGWGTPQTLQSGSVGTPAMAADATGGAMAVWTNSNSATIDIFASRFQPATGWSSPQLVEGFAAFDFAPQVGMDAAGNAIVAWIHFDPATSVRTLFANRFTPAGGWGTPQLVSAGGAGNTVQEVSIAVSPGGDAALVWSESNAVTRNIWANRFVAASGWGPPQLIEADTGVALAPKVAIDGGGNAMAVWIEFDGSFFSAVANRFVASSGWSTPVIIDNNTTGDVFQVEVGVDGGGNAIAVWVQSEGTTGISRVNSNRFQVTTGSWGTPQTVQLGNTALVQSEVRLAVDASGNALAAWNAFVDSGMGFFEEVDANRFTPALGWAGPQAIQTSGESDFGPRLAFDGFGRGTVVSISRVTPNTSLPSRRFE